MPKELRGTWCEMTTANDTVITGIHRRCRAVMIESDLIVDARHVFSGEHTCTVLSVMPKGNSYLVDTRCRHIEGKDIDRRRVRERWRLFNKGRRLEIRDAKALP